MENYDDLERRLRSLEDERTIRQLILAYGPAADAGMAALTALRWVEDGVYDWDAAAEPYQGRAGIDAMIRADLHRTLMATGVAHFSGPPFIEVDGDRATALAYSIIMRRETGEERFYIWRVCAIRWEFERNDSVWAARRRTNRLLDETGAGSELFAAALGDLFGELAK